MKVRLIKFKSVFIVSLSAKISKSIYEGYIIRISAPWDVTGLVLFCRLPL